jgi:hypothetical protein
MAATGSAQDLVASYPFSGNVQDESSFNNSASVNAAQLTADRFGVASNAFNFDGIQGSITAPNAPHLQSPTTTIAFWVRVNSLPGQGEVYLASHGGWQERWKISLPPHGKPVFTTNNTSGISDMDSGDGNELVPGEWAHLTFVHDGSKDLIYLNGTLAAEKDVEGDMNTTTHPFGMGYNPIDKANYLDGDLDEVMVWNGAVDAATIAALYAAQSTAPKFQAGVVASFSFDGNLSDGSGFDNQAKGTTGRFMPDRFGFGNQAYAFNGVDATVTADNSAQLNSDSVTVAFWVNMNELPGNGEVYLASHGGWQERWKISLPPHGKPVWTTNNESGISDMDSGDGNELVPGEWTHLTFVHDGANDMIYVNGALVASKEVTGAMNSTVHPLGIGYNPIDAANHMNGMIDEFIIANTALSADDIAALYTEQSTPNFDVDDPEVLRLSFSGDLKDESQFGNDAMNMGGVHTQDRHGFGANAISFDGVSSAAYAANSVQYNSAFTTVAFWVNLNELPGNGEVYLASHGGWQERWKISLPPHGKPVWTTNGENGISDMDSGDGNELVPGTWAHLAFVHGATSDMIYLNGQLAAEKAVGGALNTTSFPFGIGFNPIDMGNYVNGAIDDIRVFNRELSAQEISDLYDVEVVEPVIPGDLVAYYMLNANAKDATPYRNNGTVMGARADRDRFSRANHAMTFNGVSDFIEASNSSPLNTPQASVSFWINVNELPGNGEAFLISYGGWQERFKISLPTHGKPVWTTNSTDGISDMDSGDGNELIPGTWTHVVMTHDGATDKIYFDGSMVAEKEVTGDLNSTTQPLGIGYNIIDGGSYFNGSLDDIQIYRVALTDTEVADLYAAQSADPMNPDMTPPTAPLGLTGEAINTIVNLSWNPSTDEESGVANYNVYVDSMLMISTYELSASLEGLEPMTEYLFGVSAVDSAGNESNTTSLSLTTGMDATPDTTKPTTPSNLSIAAGSNSVVFSWDASEDEGGVEGYIIYVDGVVFDTLGADQTSIFIGGLESETLYTFEVEAFDFSGNFSDLADITEATEPPVDTGEPGLVAHYPFEGNANDATPYENHGVIGGDPIFEMVADRPNASGQAIVFDGDRDSVLAPNAVQLISDYTTVSFWIRVDDINITDAEAYILDFGHWDERWKISLPQHTKIVWTTNSKNAQFDNFISDMDSGDGNELVEGFWWYVTMVHDGENDIIYLDGVEVNSKPVMGTLNSTGRPLGFGNNPINGGQYFIGALDEVKIYNKALTPQEIENLYNNGTTGVPYLNEELHKYVDMVYPNPTDGEISIKHQFDSGELLIRIMDVQGRQVSHRKLNVNGSNNINMDLSELANGSYSMNFVLDGKILGSIPFVKQ